MSVEIKADIRHWLRELDKKYFCVMLGFAVMVYFPLISLKLTNTVDGLWTTAEYMAGAWELSNGRWFWLVTSFLRFSLQLEPINAVVCLVLVSLGVTRLHMLFKPAWMRTSCIDWLAGLCYVSNVVVGCYLSFHFIAPEYGFSFFFAMLATEHVIRGKSAVSSIVPAAVLLALSLGLYQTNLACFCLVLLAYFLLLLFQNGEKQKIREYICKSLASAASGAVLYLLILKITLWATGTAMADYQGGADISVSGILKNLPSSVEKCYELFYRYFFGTLVKHNMLQETAVVFALIFCVVGAALACRLVRLIRRKDWENTFYGTAALLVLPMMCTVFMVATSQALFYIPMSGGLALFLPVCFWLLDSSREAEDFLCPERDELFTYSGLDLLLKRYVIQSRSRVPLETPQEMFLGIALHLAMNEGSDRMGWVKRFYDMLSRMEVTMATPTMSNARKPYHQLSSCFVDTVPDSLDGIYRSLDNFAKVSKFGGGMGMYFGKVRAAGSTIRGFQGAAGGVIRWIRLVNDTAVAVDQLGMRQGAVAVYLDAWHRDLPEFLQLRTNNGDDRMKAHDVFPAVCYPDLFWRLAEENIDAPWHLMCPHEILTVKGYALEDYWGTEWEKRYLDCVNDPRIEKRSVTVKDIVRLVLRSAVETGTPFAFNRDSVNRMNPNGHTGMIYCSNLCTEIAQNMAPIEHISTEVHTENGDTVVVTATRPGEFVVCNLASLSLGNLPVEDEAYMERTVETAIRALDNVIDLNFYPLEYARLTNQKYRSIGLGVSGYHHMLAKRGIRWESDEHLAFTDAVFELINYAAVKADTALAREKGRYALFEGSDWQTGAYFEKRGYTSEKWRALAKTVAVQGMRNAYLLAVAPTSSTSILSGTSAGIDPIMKKFFLEEKKGSMLPRVAPELSMDTWWYYKAAHLIDQSWSVRAAGLRQRHIDQAQSMNLYITNDYSMRQVLRLYLEAWRAGVKTIYYVRSKALEVEDCESCSS